MSRALRAPHMERDIPAGQQRFEVRTIRTCHVVGAIQEPVLPPQLANALQFVVRQRHNDDFRGLVHRRFELRDLGVDLRIVEDVSIDFRERGVPVRQPAQQDDELE